MSYYAREGKTGWRPFKCSIVDLSRNTNSIMDVRGQDFFSPPLDNTETATKVLEALRRSSATTCLRLVLWWLGTPKCLSSQLLDVCGLGLGIGPSFFEAITERIAPPDVRKLQPLQPFRPDGQPYPIHIIAGNYIATTAYDYVKKVDVPPVLLLVGWDQQIGLDPEDRFKGVLIPTIWQTTWVLDNALSPPPRIWDKAKVLDTQVPSERLHIQSRIYVDCLHHVCRTIEYAEQSNEDFILLASLPLMFLITMEVNARIRLLRQSIMGVFYDNDCDMQMIKKNRFLLRRYMVESEGSQKSISRYFWSHNAGHLLSCEGYKRIEEPWKDALNEAQALEEEVRDNLQLEASYLSLEESRQSIRLSNHQIEESRRGTTPNFHHYSSG